MIIVRRLPRRDRGAAIIESQRFAGEGFEPLSPGIGAAEPIAFTGGPPPPVEAFPAPLTVDLADYFIPADPARYREDCYSPEFWPNTWRSRLRQRLRAIGIRLGLVRRGLISTDHRHP